MEIDLFANKKGEEELEKGEGMQTKNRIKMYCVQVKIPHDDHDPYVLRTCANKMIDMEYVYCLL